MLAMIPFERFAPGRVNLIGEHTDHAGGLALPAAIDRGITITVTGISDTIRLTSADFGTAEVSAKGGAGATGWARYVAAVAAELASSGRAPVGIEGEVTSDLPTGAGLASSAALEVVAALALCAAADFDLAPLDLAQLCRRAEHRAVGVPCGVMDHVASLFGRRDHALLLDTSTVTFEEVRIPDQVRVLVLDSGVHRELADSNYETRRDELRRGLAGATDPVSRRRLRHFRTENRRVQEVVAALRSDPPDLERAGRLLTEGHTSLRDDFEASTMELDVMVDEAVGAGAYGARVTGAGFGGCVVALAPADRAELIGADAVDSYARRFPDRSSSWMVCRAADGAR